MKTREEIEAEIEDLKNHNVLQKEPAQVDQDPTLALLQINFEARINALKWVLGEV